jgi:uncharacterized protein
MTQDLLPTAATIARELNARVSQVEAAVRLLDDGATVPFIARYRKEATEGLKDTQLRVLAERLHYLRELTERRTVILQTIREQEKLTNELEKAILSATTKAHLEDLYLPYRPKRRTKALLAKEAGLEPLAIQLLNDPTKDPQAVAAAFINAEKEIPTVEAALEGARQILIEQFAEDATLLNELREYLWQHGVVKSTAAKGKNANDSKFADYRDYAEPIKKIPSHRSMALFRGRRENILKLSLTLPNDPDYGVKRVCAFFNIIDQQRCGDAWIMDTVRLAWKIKLFSKLELELLTRLREQADEEAIRVFSSNLRDLLLAAPAGQAVTMGLDPGIRTGVKVAVVNETGKLLDYTTIYPLAPHNEWHESIPALAKLAAKYHVKLISIGNGTGSRETDRLVGELIKMYPDLKLSKIIVNEAGASVYSASELAANEFPDLDVALRGAVSIARRLQDPLAELVKIEPKSIGVGQYQHDINQSRLARGLEGVVEDCVNTVGVDINTASVALLSHVAGLNEALAKNIVQYRDEHGAYRNREQLKQLPRMGEKTFQQAAGFLRIHNGDNPLDASGVHPEAYPIVEKILADKHVNITQAIGDRELLQSVNAASYVDDQYGLPTLHDILVELEKPGRDPRPKFKTVNFKEGIEDIQHLEIGMILEGVVSNVTNFGAFVDIGVHQDGLVHISAMTDRFINDPRSIVKANDVIKVKVIEIDKERRRIGLTMKLEDKSTTMPPKATVPPIKEKKIQRQHLSKKPSSKQPEPEKKPVYKTVIFNTAMADALSKLKREHE